MDRRRMYDRQNSSSETPTTPSSPVTASPFNRHARAGSTGSAMTNARRAQNNATKAAAQRLAQVMSHQADDDEDEDDTPLDYSAISGSGGIGLGGGRPMPTRSPMSVRSVQDPSARSRSPMPVRSVQDQHPSSRSRSPASVRSAQEPQPPPRSHSPASVRNIQEQPQSLKAISNVRSSLSSNTAAEQPPPKISTTVINAEQQPPAARSTTGNRTLDLSPSARTILTTRSSQPSNNDQPPSARSNSGRPSGLSKVVPMVPPSVPITLRPASSGGVPPSEPHDIKKDRRLSLDLGSMKVRENVNRQQRSTTELEDELDMLQEENDNLIEKLRLADERSEEAESRVRQLEQQVATLGEGVTLEARLLSRKEASLQQREAALRNASRNHGGFQATLHADAEIAREEAASALEKLRLMTHRMILTQEEMEEVCLKRCWLARYWGLCFQHGIHSDIAEAKYKFWSMYAPNPVEVVLAAGEKAKDETDLVLDDREAQRDLKKELSGEGNIENMLFVEQGLRQLASLKVEEALAVALAQHRRPNLLKAGFSDDLKLPIEGQCDAFELSQEEAEDVSFKQAWLTYIWRRAKRHEIEPDIADERLHYWINHNSKTPNSQDAVDVERGLAETKKLGIEAQLWDESRRELEEDIDDNSKTPGRSDF